MNNIISIVLPEKLLKYLRNKENWNPRNTCIDEEIADILNAYLIEYTNNYFTNPEEWKKIKSETYYPLISDIFK